LAIKTERKSNANAKLEGIVDAAYELSELGLGCESCAPHAKEIIQKYFGNNNVNPMRGHSSLVATNEKDGLPNVQQYSTHKYK